MRIVRLNEIKAIGFKDNRLYIKWKYPIMEGVDMLVYDFPNKKSCEDFYKDLIKNDR